MAEKMSCTAEKMTFLYLGLPLEGNPRHASFWQPMIDKVQRKLAKWRRFKLPRGGRATLCQSVLANLPTYYVFVCNAGQCSVFFGDINENFFLGRAFRK